MSIVAIAIMHGPIENIKTNYDVLNRSRNYENNIETIIQISWDFSIGSAFLVSTGKLQRVKDNELQPVL